MSHDHATTVPRPVLAMAGLLVAGTLMLTGAVRTGLLAREAVPAVARAEAGVAAQEVRHIAFADRADGAVIVRDADRARTLAVLIGEQDGGGFVRGVMRGMARDRHMRGLGAAAPFELTLWRNGALTLRDPQTGRAVELGSFGASNRAAFARFIGGDRA